MINWISLSDETPKSCRELIGKDNNKEVLPTSSAKKCKIMKFATGFSKEKIKNVMNESNITHWFYLD